MKDDILEDFLNTFDDSRFPEDFLKDYEALECLVHNDYGETLLVKSRRSDRYYIAKCYFDKTLLSRTTESELLKKLKHPGLPLFEDEYQNTEMLCVVREYARGISLDRYAEIKIISSEQAIDIMLQLCDILSYLHGQRPSIIHRDIKPQNIIIDDNGLIKLIDFGISRQYDETADKDTVSFGTRYFSAPEQYGFSQTNNRADIFSMGVLLGWLLTGEVEYKKAYLGIKDKRILRIVRKCTDFSPDRRCKSAEAVRRQLLDITSSGQRVIGRLMAGIILSMALLSIGFALGRYTDILTPNAFTEGVKFKEALIEQAVRLSLKKGDDQLITDTDLMNVYELFIYGNQVAGSFEDFEEIGRHKIANDGQVHNGGLGSLEDLKNLKNLRRINIALEEISDLTPLSGLIEIEQIMIKHNPIEDITPLSSLINLRELYIFDTRVSDLSPLAACFMLESIDIGQTYITSAEALEGIIGLKNLYMNKTPIRTLSGIDKFTKLEKISLSQVADGDLSPLLKLENLKAVELNESLRESAMTSLGNANFQIQFKE